MNTCILTETIYITLFFDLFYIIVYLVTLKYYLVYYLTDTTTDEEWERGYGKITVLFFFLGTSLERPTTMTKKRPESVILDVFFSSLLSGLM